MKRVLLCVSYDGTGYSGWQLQDNAPTVEGELNKALSDLHGEEISVIGASRTDAGVHALCNMAVYDTTARMPAEKVSFALNTRLPEDIRVVWSREVPADFHPRHTDTIKTYEYTIFNEPVMPPTERLYAYQVEKALDVSAMQEAAEFLKGEHDFKSYASVYTTAETTVRTITDIVVRREGAYVKIDVSGTGFLYNMVRIIAGTLIEIGLGRKEVSFAREALEARERRAAGPTAPARGLMLIKYEFAEYPELNLPEIDHMSDKYVFYGWQEATVPAVNKLYKGIETPQDLYDALSDVWCVDTCATRMRHKWSTDNKTLGQCSITSFLVQDIFGGRVYGVPLKDGTFHCFNEVNGHVFDLTSEQFKGEKLEYTLNYEQSRDEHFSKGDKLERYTLLKKLLSEKVG